MTNGQYLGLLFLRFLLGLAVGVALTFAADFAILRFRVATNRNALSTIVVRPYYAVQRKDHKLEYMFDEPHEESCANSLFPHMGCSPCWYLRRHRDQETPI